jgi:hypothetical protein
MAKVYGMRENSTSSESYDRLSDNEIYVRIYDEIERGIMDKAAQARAIEEAGGNDNLVRSGYIKHRMANIRLEIELTENSARNSSPKQDLNYNKSDKAINLVIFLLFCAGFALIIFSIVTTG